MPKPSPLGAMSALAVWLAASAASFADTPVPTTASFSVSAQVVAGCGIVGTSQISGLNLGALDFGTHSAVATGQSTVKAQTNGLAVRIECSPNTVVGITVDAGLHVGAGGTLRHAQASGGSNLIAYRLYSDPAMTQPMAVGQPVTLTVSGVIDMPIYGTLSLPGPGTAAGLYTDTVQVTMSY